MTVILLIDIMRFLPRRGRNICMPLAWRLGTEYFKIQILPNLTFINHCHNIYETKITIYSYTINSMEDKIIGKILHQKVGWLITERISITDNKILWSMPICRSCMCDLKQLVDSKVMCENPSCSRKKKEIRLDKPISELQKITLRAFEAKERQSKTKKWYDIDQETKALTSSEDKSRADYWSTTKVIQTDKGLRLMVLVGKKGHNSKVQFFIDENLKQITFDTIDDLKPEEILTSFTAIFADGSKAETSYR